MQTVKVELYNLIRDGRAVGNGFLARRYIDGRGANTLASFGSNEAAARAFVAAWTPGCDAEELRLQAIAAAADGLTVAGYVAYWACHLRQLT